MKLVIAQTTGSNPISILSKIAATKNKDYVVYNQEQIELYNRCIAQKASAKRLELIQMRR